MIRKFGMVVLIVGTLMAAGCAAKPIMDYSNEIVQRYDDKALTMNDMQHAIRIALFKEAWHIQSQSPGHIVAIKGDKSGSSDHKSARVMTVDVVYTTTDFGIHYVSSEGLDYDAQSHLISREYNNAVEDLRDQIGDALQNVTTGT
jgi:hypothetical protein